MKIAIPSTAPTLGGNIARRIGTAPYFLLVETGEMNVDVLEMHPESNAPGAGIQAITEVLNWGAEVLIVDIITPHIAEVIRANGVQVIDRVQGCVETVLENYLHQQTASGEKQQSSTKVREGYITWSESLNKALKQFCTLLPMLIGIIMLIGLFQGFIPQESLLSLFSGSTIQDSLLGATLGSILTGNPVNSYVIGDSMLKTGSGLAPVAALMLAWVSVGVIQIPAEAAALGLRFTLIRSAAGFIMAIILGAGISFLMGAAV